MSRPLLVLTNLGCVRGGRPLFNGVNLELQAGQCVELRGPNGSGKSTLLRMVAGLYPDYEGSIEAGACFYLGHRPAVSALLSPRENLEWYEKACLTADDSETFHRRCDSAEALTAVGLEACAEIPCGRLSQGQQRRAALARALLAPQPLWLLDEPLTALDAEGRSMVRRLVTDRCAAGGAVLCATHEALETLDSTIVELGPGY